MPSATEVKTLWAISLAIAVVVLLVLVVLLTAVLRTAKQIDAGAKQVWTAGKQVANCTIQLALLHRTNQLVADILEGANGILHNAGRIAQHAQTCGGCPKCVTASAAPQGSVRPLNLQIPPPSPHGESDR